MKNMLSNKFIAIGGAIIVFMILVAVFAPLLTAYDYGMVDLPNKQQVPTKTISWVQIYTTRCLVPYCIWGPVSLFVSFVTVAIAIFFEVSLG